MSRLLAVYRVAALVAVTVFLCAALVCERARLGRRASEGGHFADRLGRRWALAARRIIGMRVHVDGEVPTGGVVLVTNHLGYIDIVALLCVFPAVFVARADVADWPLLGRAGRMVDTIFLDRARKRDLLRVISEMEARLSEGRNIVFFPEGTSSQGAGVLPFKSSLFEAAARQAVPVVGASLHFETAPPAPSADSSVCWWGDMTFAPHAFNLLSLRGFDAWIRFTGASHRGFDRKVLCRLAAESVEKAFVPSSDLLPSRAR